MKRPKQKPYKKKWQFSKLLTHSASLLIVTLAGCHLPINQKNQQNACLFLEENPYIAQSLLSINPSEPSRQALTLAIIEHESDHKANARPVKKWLIKSWIPLRYYSSAKGYAQGTKTTWEDFERSDPTKKSYKRYSYYDSAKFIHWYFDKNGHIIAEEPLNYYEAYFLYHDGKVGYTKKRLRRPKSLVRYAQLVKESAEKYEKQLSDCQEGIQWQNNWASL